MYVGVHAPIGSKWVSPPGLHGWGMQRYIGPREECTGSCHCYVYTVYRCSSQHAYQNRDHGVAPFGEHVKTVPPGVMLPATLPHILSVAVINEPGVFARRKQCKQHHTTAAAAEGETRYVT